MNKNNNDMADAIEALAEFGERVVYGVIAFFSTSLIMQWGFNVPMKETIEPAILNAGIAYYTHAATGRIIRALWCIARRRNSGISDDRSSSRSNTTHHS